MGIEKFFSTINKNFNIISNDQTLKIKYLFIDFNSIIHVVSSKLLDKVNKGEEYKIGSEELTLDNFDDLIIQEVNNYLVNLIKLCDLQILELVYIALDGVPTFAKILEQKKRRYMGDFIDKLLEKYSLPFTWNKNNISPGTKFMDKLNLFLEKIKLIVNNKQNKDPNFEFYTNIQKFEVSDTNQKGEGEIKIFDYINQFNDQIGFYSPDADVILLSAISKKAQLINIIKYEQNTDTFYLISIPLFIESIYNYCSSRINVSINKNNLINDICFIFTVLGNDFIPKCEAILTNYDFLFLIDIYLINFIDYGYILKDIIDTTVLFNFFKILASHEKRLLFRNSYQNLFNNFNYANQNNFILDLNKLKNNDIIISKQFGTPFYNFYNNILFYIDPSKIKELNHPKYGCLEFYLIDKNKLIQIIKKSLSYILPINLLVNIDIHNVHNYEKLRQNKYISNQQKHIIAMKDLTLREKENYLINNRLDKYFHLFNPYNQFYQNIIKTKHINHDYYYNTFFNNNEKNIVNSYLRGLKWIHQYYFRRDLPIDETWFYPYFKTPLFNSIIKYYSPNLLQLTFNYIPLDITPFEQLLYITPLRINHIPDFYHQNIISLFIQNHPQYFYNLDEIYLAIKSNNINHHLFNCSNSVFISKCHYHILDYIVDINKFVQSLRKIFKSHSHS